MTKRILLALTMVALVGCKKPSEGDCKRAIANIRALLGTDKLTEDSGQNSAWVRSCRGSAKKESVQCAMEASTLDQLKRCGLLKGEELDELMAPVGGPPAPVVDAAVAPVASVIDAAAAPVAPVIDAAGAADPGAGSAPATGAGSAPASAPGSAVTP